MRKFFQILKGQDNSEYEGRRLRDVDGNLIKCKKKQIESDRKLLSWGI